MRNGGLVRQRCGKVGLSRNEQRAARKKAEHGAHGKPRQRRGHSRHDRVARYRGRRRPPQTIRHRFFQHRIKGGVQCRILRLPLMNPGGFLGMAGEPLPHLLRSGRGQLTVHQGV